MRKVAETLFLGIFILILSLFMWRLTHSFVGWMVFFVPGATFIMLGICLIAEEELKGGHWR